MISDSDSLETTSACQAPWRRSLFASVASFVTFAVRSVRIEIRFSDDSSRFGGEGDVGVDYGRRGPGPSQGDHRPVVPGDEVVITDQQQPVARLVATRRAERKLGTMCGTVLYMAPDFDAPLDDFKEYME